MHPLVVFPCNELRPSQVDAAFSTEAHAAQQSGFNVALIDHSALQSGDMERALKPLRHEPGPSILYRGWMIHAERYSSLSRSLQARGFTLYTSPADYREAHWLPQAVEVLRHSTPQTVYLSGHPPFAEADLVGLLERLGPGPAVVKDFVKSQKHLWAEACFIPDAGDMKSALSVVARFLEVQPEPEGGLVLRRFEPFAIAGEKGGRPIAVEWRTWWLESMPLAMTPNHDVEVVGPKPPREMMAEVAGRFKNPFLTLDVAQRTDGEWRVVEAGDGQVSGLPPALPPDEFYTRLAKRLRERGVLDN